MGRLLFIYAVALSIPLSLALGAWQANRYAALKRETARLGREQELLLDANKQLITEIAGLSSSARIEEVARGALGMDKKSPEDVLQISIAAARDSRAAGDGARHGR